MSAAASIKWESFVGTAAVATSSHVLEVNNATYKRGTLLYQHFNDNLEKSTLTTKSLNFLQKKKQYKYYGINDNDNYYLKKVNNNNFKKYERTAYASFTTFISKRQSSLSFSITLPSTLLIFLRILLSLKRKKLNKYLYSIQLMSLSNVVLFIVRYLLLIMFLLTITIFYNLLLFNLIPTATAAPLTNEVASNVGLKLNNLQTKLLKKNQINVRVNIKNQKQQQPENQKRKRRHIALAMSTDAVENLAKKIIDDKFFLLFFDESLLRKKKNRINELKNWLDLARVNCFVIFQYLFYLKLNQVKIYT